MNLQEVIKSTSVEPELLSEIWGWTCGSDSKESACSAGDPSLIPGSGRSPGERNDKGAWQAIVHEVESWTQLSD